MDANASANGKKKEQRHATHLKAKETAQQARQPAARPNMIHLQNRYSPM